MQQHSNHFHTHHMSSCVSSLINLTDCDVICRNSTAAVTTQFIHIYSTHMHTCTLTHAHMHTHTCKHAHPHMHTCTHTCSILFPVTFPQKNVCWSAARPGISVSSTSSPFRLRTVVCPTNDTTKVLSSRLLPGPLRKDQIPTRERGKS